MRVMPPAIYPLRLWHNRFPIVVGEKNVSKSAFRKVSVSIDLHVMLDDERVDNH